jgi:hypothetical protein
MTVYGKIAPNNQINARYPYVCVVSSSGWPGCPTTGSDVALGGATATIPPSHNGVVLFLANSRVQGDLADPRGTVALIDNG